MAQRTPQKHTRKQTAGNSRQPALIVGIGASAGGLAAFNEFLSQTPQDSGLAFVLLPHLDPDYKSVMRDLLSRHTPMRVTQAREGQVVKANRVYVVAPAHGLIIATGKLHLVPLQQPRYRWTVLDQFLRSLAADQSERAVGIILSGTGQHGILGLKEIKEVGGLVLAQTPGTCQHPQMPQSAIDSGIVDLVLPAGDMPAALMRYADHSYLRDQPAEDEAEPELIEGILNILRTRGGFDFRSYRENMVLRRIRRRMSLCHLYSLEDYRQRLCDVPTEIEALTQDLLIGVTAFFRDAPVFDILRQQVFPEMVEHSDSDSPVRVWVPACSTGEEAYTLAMLLFEAFGAAGKTPSIQVFATDIDERALNIARHGVYPGNIIGDVSPQRLQRFFVPLEGDRYRVKQQLRDTVVFASQNILGDAPFSHLDLISCRNLLIYLQPEMQARVIQLFHFALNDKGSLLLGPSESLGRHKELFEVTSQQWRVFRRRPTAERLPSAIPIGSTPYRRLKDSLSATALRGTERAGYADLVIKTLLADYAPASVLINRQYEVLRFYGPTAPYLELPDGEPSLNLLSLLRRGLSSRVRALMHRAWRDQQTVVDAQAQVLREGHYHGCRLTVRPMPAGVGSQLLLLSFEERAQAVPVDAQAQAQESAPNDLHLVEHLERELQTTRDDLQGNLEALESANEGLKVANEEMMSVNEELQSANEELETSKEELQSMNEELNTVNSELQAKVEELEARHDDIANLLASTDIATLFLDRTLCIKLFNPPMATLMNLRAGDIDRPFSDFSGRVRGDAFESDAQQVLARLTPVERVVSSGPDAAGDKQPRSFLRRMTPYRASNNRIGGVVVTFVDITERYRQEQRLEQGVQARTAELNRSQQRLSLALQAAGAAVWEMDAQRRRELISDDAHRSMFGELPADMEDSWDWWLERIDPQQRPAVELSLQRALDGDGDRWEEVYKFRMATGAYHWMSDIAHISRDVTGRWLCASGAMIDIHERRELELAAKDRGERLAAIMDSTADIIIVFDCQGVITDCNPITGEMLGYRVEELEGKSILELIPERRRKIYQDALRSGRPFQSFKDAMRGHQLLGQRKDGTTFPLDIKLSSVASRGLLVLVAHDLSELHALQQKMGDISTWEQENIGRELHDSLGQRLTGLHMLATQLRPHLRRCQPNHVQLLEDMIEQLKEAAIEVSRLSRGLAPITASARGLTDALASLVERTHGTGASQCHFRNRAADAAVDPAVAHQLYRIAQEALHNAVKYAGAKAITISLVHRAQQLELLIEDDGVGFDTVAARNLEGLGMRIMRYRANMISAALSIDSAPGQGTRIRCIYYPS